MNKRTSLLKNKYFQRQLGDAIMQTGKRLMTHAFPNKIDPYNDGDCGETLALLVMVVARNYYGSIQAEQQLSAFRGCYVGMLLEIAYWEGIVFPDDVHRECTEVRGWYRRYEGARGAFRTPD